MCPCRTEGALRELLPRWTARSCDLHLDPHRPFAFRMIVRVHRTETSPCVSRRVRTVLQPGAARSWNEVRCVENESNPSYGLGIIACSLLTRRNSPRPFAQLTVWAGGDSIDSVTLRKSRGAFVTDGIAHLSSHFHSCIHQSYLPHDCALLQHSLQTGGRRGYGS